MKANKFCLLPGLVVVMTGVSLLLGCASSLAAPTTAKPYYEGKVITLVTPNFPGGGVDLWARLLIRYLYKPW